MSDEGCECPASKIFKLLSRGYEIDAKDKDSLKRLLDEVLNSEDKEILRQMPKRKRI